MLLTLDAAHMQVIQRPCLRGASRQNLKDLGRRMTMMLTLRVWQPRRIQYHKFADCRGRVDESKQGFHQQAGSGSGGPAAPHSAVKCVQKGPSTTHAVPSKPLMLN